MKPRVHSLMKEAAIGALAQELLPTLLTRQVVLREDPSFFRPTRDKPILRITVDRIRDAFVAAELFLELRSERLRNSEAKLARARERRVKRGPVTKKRRRRRRPPKEKR